MKILITTATVGGGHNQAAAALEEIWRELRPADTVEKVDVLNFTSPLYRKAYSSGYLQVAEHLPHMYGMLFKKSDNPALLRRLTNLRRVSARAVGGKFLKHLKAFGPDVVVCTHFMPLEMLGHLRARAKNGPSPKVATVVTDFEAHALWMEPSVDLYCVAAEDTKARLVARELAPENIVVTGIPIARKFSAKTNPAELRRRMGWRDDLPIVLVLAGGFGMGPVGKILAAMDGVEQAVQNVVVCGKNEELRRQLAGDPHKHPTQVLGFCTNMHELMSAASLIVTKPGGLTSSEAMAMGKPLLIVNPIPGQEEANSDFLLEKGAAAKANRLEDVPYKIGELLGSRKLAQMARAAKSLGRPNAAEAICQEVMRRFGG